MEIFLLYLITRLDALWGLGLLMFIVGAFLLFIATIANADVDEKELRPYRKFAVVMLLLGTPLWVLTPDKDDAIFIAAGAGVIAAAKSETAQRVAGKSVQIVEQYLDELIKDKAKKKE